MGTTSDKLTYLNTTKGKIKDVINMTGANITSDTTFRNYATKLYDGYISVLKDKNTLLDNMPKGTSTGAITDAADLPVYEDKMSKESTQDGTPTPESPVEVKTVKGYRNLFDKDNANILNAHLLGFTKISNLSPNNKTLYVPCKKNTTYTIQKLQSGYFIAGTTIETPTNGLAYSNRKTSSETSLTITTDASAEYLIVYFWNVSDTLTEQEILDSIMITEGTEVLPYVPYGTNWIYTTITDGTNTRNYTIPLGNNEIAGIGNYKDELIVDKNGKCWLNKKISKVVLNGSENWALYNANSVQPRRFGLENKTLWTQDNMSLKSNYFIGGLKNSQNNFEIWTQKNYIVITDNSEYWSNATNFKTWLSTHNTDVYYPLATPQLIDLNYTVDLTLFEGINNISNSEDMDMEIKYIKDTYE